MNQTGNSEDSEITKGNDSKKKRKCGSGQNHLSNRFANLQVEPTFTNSKKHLSTKSTDVQVEHSSDDISAVTSQGAVAATAERVKSPIEGNCQEKKTKKKKKRKPDPRDTKVCFCLD